MEKKSEFFGRLLKAGVASIARCEGKTERAVEADLGAQIGVAGDTIQRYKTGYLPPEHRTAQILAEACVRKGLLGREWLQKFLHAARYPFAERLLDALCPAPQARPRPSRVYENLPAPTYSQFVMREHVFAEVIDGLGQRSAAVLIVGMGGNGKTSLAREAAARCLRGDGDAPPFDSVVWVSDKDRPGTTNLSTVLDEIARTLDYPGFTQFAHDEKRHEVEQLLRRQRVLLVIDNFETITDGALLAWLLRLPEPSKALITSREYRREWRSSWPVELRGMSEAEAHALVRQRLRHLRIETLLSDAVQLDPLIVATGGNPKAIEITLGLVKYERRPLQQVVDDLYAARGELFDDLFARSWALLDEAARRVLLVATFFPSSASVEALSASADVQGFAFDRAIERLVDLALLDVQQADLSNPPRYALHPLVRAFAGVKLAEQPGFEEDARNRWVVWYIALVPQPEQHRLVYDRLYLIDPESEALPAVLKWMLHHRRSSDLLAMAKTMSHYYHVRGLWDKELSIDLIYIEAAQYLSDAQAEVFARSYYAQLLAKQGDLTAGQENIERLHMLVQHPMISVDALCEYHHAIALRYMAANQYSAAQAEWEKSLTDTSQLLSDSYAANLQWLAKSFYLQSRRDEARQLLETALAYVREHGIERATFSHIQLATIDLDLGNLERAATRLSEAYALAQRYQDRALTALAQSQYARLHALRGDIPAARTAYTEAIDLFERLGMRRELADARQALAEIGASAEAVE